jgi:Sigma-70, region 4
MTVYYADVHGHRYREITEILDIPVGTVMSRLHSARRRLRELLADVAHDHGLTWASIAVGFNDVVCQTVWIGKDTSLPHPGIGHERGPQVWGR